MSKITYTDKAPFQTNENVPIENKCTADDMNEIKEVVNTNADELENKQPKEEGKGLSTNDFTNGYKQKLDALTNYDDTEIKQDIENLKAENEKLKENQIHITTDQSSNINVQDCSNLEGRIDVEGNSVQEEEATPEAPVEIQNVEGNVDITICNKNLFDKNNTNIINGYFTTSNIISEPNNRTIWVKCKPNTTYTVQKKAGQRFAVGFTEEEPIIGSSVQTPKTDNYGNKITNTSLGNSKYIVVYVANYNVGTEILWQDILNSLQIEENPIATEYVEHQSQTITFPLSEEQKLMKGDYLADDGIHHAIRVLELTGTEVYTEYNPTTYNPKNICSFKLQQILPKNANTNLALSSHFILKDLIQNNINPESGKFAYYTDEGLSNNSLYFSIDYTDIGVESTDTSEQKIQKFKDWIVQQKTNGNPVLIYYGLSKENEQIEVYTPEQQEAYNKLQKVLPYKLVTNIFTDLALLKFNYIADTKTYIDNKTTNIQNQINTINELLNNESQQNEEIPENQNITLLE